MMCVSRAQRSMSIVQANGALQNRDRGHANCLRSHSVATDRGQPMAQRERENMFDRFQRFAILAGLLALLAAMSAPTAAQAPNLAGKNVTMIIGSGTGGIFDLWGRLVARHIGKHLPGKPTVVSQTMPGAGSFNAANYIYNAAPRDGTSMGIIAGAAPLGPITGASGARFDPTRFTWVGTANTDTHVCIAM